ncbi:hypothetical protein ACUL41_05040 [Virgibacillus natechei]|uniref:hypothetical protein n=1 Tax=Virgibacillus sp. CBA3643 TaxID=2942278 RepID=UPI0035A28E21
MKKGRGKGLLFVFLLVMIIAIIVTVYILRTTSPERQAETAVEAFYTFEQEGAFSDSWEMFHPLMQEKFSKAHYLENRPHVFMNHFDVTTFTYSISDAQKVNNWKMEADAEPIDVVYHVQVSQHFNSKYGNLTIVQDVYVVMWEEEWRVMWDYGE